MIVAARLAVDHQPRDAASARSSTPSSSAGASSTAGLPAERDLQLEHRDPPKDLEAQGRRGLARGALPPRVREHVRRRRADRRSPWPPDPLELLEEPLAGTGGRAARGRGAGGRRGARRPVRRRPRRALAAPRDRRRWAARRSWRPRSWSAPRSRSRRPPRWRRRCPEGAAVLPLALRGRALSVLVFSAPPAGDLEALAARAARRRSSWPSATPTCWPARAGTARAARPPSSSRTSCRRASPRLDGAEVAGSILPAYDVGGDWIDHCAMADGGWLGVADAVGKGPQASAISAIALGAYRATRRGGGDLADAAASIHAALRALEVRRHLHERRPRQLGRPVVVADLAALRAPAARWSGTPSAVCARSRAATAPSSGSTASTRRARPPARRSRPTSSSSSSPTACSSARRRARSPSARTGCGAPWRRWRAPSATAATSAVLDAVATTYDGPLRDDASVLVLAPVPATGPAARRAP